MNQIAIGFQMVRMRNADVYNQLLNDVSENVKKKKKGKMHCLGRFITSHISKANSLPFEEVSFDWFNFFFPHSLTFEIIDLSNFERHQL